MNKNRGRPKSIVTKSEPIRIRLTKEQMYWLKTIMSKTGKSLKIKYVSVNDFIKCRGKGLEYQVIYDRLFDRDFDTSKESEFVETEKFIKLRDGLTQCLSNFIYDGCPFKYISWQHEAIKDKMVNEHTPLNEIKGVKNKIKYLITRYL